MPKKTQQNGFSKRVRELAADLAQAAVHTKFAEDFTGAELAQWALDCAVAILSYGSDEVGG